MSVTKLSTCGCPEHGEFVYALDSEHPCVYNQVITTVNGLEVTRDYYLNSVLMFTVVTTYVKIGTDFYIEGNKLIH